jgi:hypothetical protein
MVKQIITLSAIATLATTSFASTDLETKVLELEKKMNTLEKKHKKLKKKFNKVKKHTAGDNLKFNVDFRNQLDLIETKGKDASNNTVKESNDIITSRLDLGMVSSPSNKIVFKAKMGINNVWGGHPAKSDTSAKDWQSSNKPNDHTVRVKEAIVIYKTDSGIMWSLGRRPSSDGFLANHRQNTQSPNSPLAHVTNMEVDAGMVKLGEKYTKLPGSFVKIVGGRAHDPVNTINDDFAYMSDATYGSGATIENDKDVNFIGLLGNAYDNGQYRLMFQRMAILNTKGKNENTNVIKVGAGKACLTALSLQVDGVSDESDFLSETVAFASIARSEYDPNSGYSLLGSTDKKSGNSIWLGATFPDNFSEDGRLGVEYNQGSKYWTPMTWAEDTVAGSKIAVRGKATEVYWNTKIGGSDNLTAQVRYTRMQHDYSINNRCKGWAAPQDVDLTTTNMTFSVRYIY